MGNIRSKPVPEVTSDGKLGTDILAHKRLSIAQRESTRKRLARIECLPAPIGGNRSQAVAFQYPSDHTFDYDEAILGVNPRKVTLGAHVQNGGAFSGVVRVVSLFLGRTGEWWQTTGSGVIIDDYHVMTVGHNIWSLEGGLALCISIHRDERAGPEHLYKRYVDAGAVHYQWAQACFEAKESTFMRKSSWENDLAVLRVSKRFHEGCQRMEYRQTPIGTTDVGIYGFPGDMPIVEGVWQASLCISPSKVTYAPSTSTMLDHDGDTEGGNSGGPVVDCFGNVIALHRGFDKVDRARINKAVALLVNGNDPEKLMQTIDVFSGEKSIEDFQVREVNKFTIGKCTAAYFGWD